MTRVQKKVCFSCRKRKLLTSFYKHPSMADGRLNKCIECAKADVRENRLAKIDYYRQFDRDRAMREDRVAAREKYRGTPVGKAAVMRAHRWQRIVRPERYKARYAVANALQKGVLKRQPCEKCGTGRAHAHHEDYSKPLDVRWLCPSCHASHHKRAA